MESLTQKSARLEFALRAEISADQRQRLMMEMNARIRAEQSETQKEKQRRQDAEFVAMLETVFASPQKIEQFTIKLDRYDTATVQALMDNERDVLAVREKIDAMMLKAHTLPDGRRVFKTEDGTRVFDEFGSQLKADEIEPQLIDDSRPRWETLTSAHVEAKRLTDERKELIDYQAKLDTARERTKDPTLTEDELTALDKELGQSMPERVRKLAGEPAQAAPEAKATAASDAEMSPPEARSAGLAAKAMQPFQP